MSSEDQEETEAEEAARYEKLAQEWGEPYVDLDRYKPEAKALAMLPEGLVRQHGVLPLKKDGMILYVALSDTNDLQALDAVKLASRCMVRGVLASPLQLSQAISRAYGEGKPELSA
ncbi:MAG: hypothetical protein H7308_09710 [Chthonomonadaceae bacterium]|nr:hypothetical protein [Chthonomonadaceae bacterium]